tara:strand:- start:199 stop:903 length:705 start_codon:yes stop_codon:yes gene_type:complete
MEFANQNILITGAADGLGHAISKSFANTKANLFLIDINYDKLVENNISNSNNIKCDLSNINSVKNLINKFSQEKVHIDVLIHNAAVLVPKSFENTTTEYWDQMTNISLNSGYLFSNYAWKNMKKNKKGVIIFVSSRSGVEGFENESAYCASKHGLEGLMKSLAIEGFKNGIQVFTVTPGMFMNTPMSEQNYEDEYKKKWVDPIELAPAFLKLASGSQNKLSGLHVNAWELSRED